MSDPARDPVAADIRALLFDGLMRIGADGLPEPALAESWEVDDAGLVYTFTLRSDVTWHDGAPLTADDALFTLRAIQRRGFAGDPTISAIWRDILIDKVGERSIRCKLTAPFAPFLSLVTFPILPAHLLGDLPPEQWAGAAYSVKPIGTGPYRLAEINGEHALLDANPHYFGGSHLSIASSCAFSPIFRPCDRRSTVAIFKGWGFLAPAICRRSISRADSRAIRCRSIAQFSWPSICAPARWPIVGLRRALAEGLDKQELIKRALDGQVSLLDTPILPGWWAASPKITWIRPIHSVPAMR